jgi:hypothetical protein
MMAVAQHELILHENMCQAKPAVLDHSAVGGRTEPKALLGMLMVQSEPESSPMSSMSAGNMACIKECEAGGVKGQTQGSLEHAFFVVSLSNEEAQEKQLEVPCQSIESCHSSMGCEPGELEEVDFLCASDVPPLETTARPHAEMQLIQLE